MAVAKAKGEPGKIGLREVRALSENAELFDAGPGSVPAFGVRRRTGPGISYFVMFRTAEGRLRRYTIGRHGAPWTPDLARDKALSILTDAKVHGGDPAADKREKREAATVADLCDSYLAEADAGRLMTRRGAKKASTLVNDRGRIDRHIKPLLGAKKVAAVTSADVERFMHDVAKGKTKTKAGAEPIKTGKLRGRSIVRGGEGAASRTVGLLGALFTYALKHRMRSDNPVNGTIRFPGKPRERRLTAAEYAKLGAALASGQEVAEGRLAIWPDALAAARFLALTGWRSGEALGLRWRDVDRAGRVARLTDTKTGASVRPLSQAALAALPAHEGPADALVFSAPRAAHAMCGFSKVFGRMIVGHGLAADVTPHTLRHSWASLANDLGFTEATVGMLIGHKGSGVTRGYIHVGDAVFVAADKIAGAVADAMAGTPPR